MSFVFYFSRCDKLIYLSFASSYASSKKNSTPPDEVLGRDPGLPDRGAEQRRAGDEDAPVEKEELKGSRVFFS